MKTIIFFDVDNTIYNNTLGEIPPQTKSLLKLLSQRKDVSLGLATGRGFKKLDIIKEILHYFTYKVLVNGAFVINNGKVIVDQPINKQDIAEVLELTKGHKLNIGMVGINDEAVNYWDDRVSYGLKAVRGIFPKINKHYYLDNEVYQLWMFADSEAKILEIAKQMPKFRVFPWHQGGADFTYPHINKSSGINACIKDEINYQLITVGDGANDIEMIEMAHIGIAMDNTRFTELKEKADHIAPHIHEDQLHDFFKKLNLI